MTGWTPQQHAQVETELWQAYNDGYAAACADIAAGHVELHDTWVDVGRKTHEQHIAERIALFERCAEQVHARYGTREWVVPQ